MNIKMYNTSSDHRCLNKYLTNEIDLSAQLTDVVDIMNPELLLDITVAKLSSNYIYIPDWDRYYFISNKNIINGNQVRISATLDPLMSFRTAILNSLVIAERSSSSYEDYIVDPVVSDSGKIRTYLRKMATVFRPATSSNNYCLMIGGK